MIKTDVGNDTQVRLNDVGAVQSSSRPTSMDGYIHLLFSEIGECHGGGKFKKEGWTVRRNTVLFYKIDDKFPDLPEIAVYADYVHGNPLSEEKYKSGFIACSL